MAPVIPAHKKTHISKDATGDSHCGNVSSSAQVAVCRYVHVLTLHARKHITAVIRLAEYAQRFYPPTATEEILQELLPSFTTHHAEDALTVQGFLSLFVPVSQPKHSITKAKLYDNGIHPKEYLPTIFSMWSMVTSSFLFDAQCIELLSRIAEANVSEPFPVFSNDQIKTVFTASLRIMNLPVGSRVDGNSSSGNRTGGSSGHNQYAGRVDLKAGSALILRRKPVSFDSSES